MDASAPEHGEIECPSCRRALDNPRSSTCRGCGLWWSSLDAGTERLSSRPSEGAPPEARFVLREYPGGTTIAFFLVACFCASAILAYIWLISREPRRLDNWGWLAIVLVVGGAAGTGCAIVVVKSLLQWLKPTYLESDGTRLRIRAWNTWHGGWRPRRTDASVSVGDVQGVAIKAGQGGWSFDTQLFLVHSSGLLIGTGWSGSKGRSIRLGENLLVWLSSHHEA